MASVGRMTMLGELQRFKESMSANVNDLQSYDGSRVRFEALVGQAQTLTQQQGALTASKQEISKQLQEVLTEAQRLATVLRFAIKEYYGPDSEKLVEFGLRPFRGRARKQKEPENPTPEAPAPSAG